MAEHDALHHATAQAQGQRGQERGGATAGAEVSGLQLHGQEPSRNGASRPRPCSAASREIRELTRRTRGISLEQMTKELASYLRGWKSYFGFCETPSVLQGLDQWIRRRLRSVIWKQWKRRSFMAAGEQPCPERGVSDCLLRLARLTTPVAHGSSTHPNRRMRTRMYGGVAGEERVTAPPYADFHFQWQRKSRNEQ